MVIDNCSAQQTISLAVSVMWLTWSLINVISIPRLILGWALLNLTENHNMASNGVGGHLGMIEE